MGNHSVVQKIIENNDLSREEIKDLLIKIINEDEEGFHFLAFSIALLAKGETIEELLGIMDALDHFCNVDANSFPADLMDISSSGGGKYRKLNISTLSSLIVGNSNVPVAKQSFWGITSTTGSANVLQNIGLNITQISAQRLAESLNTLGIGYYHHLFMFKELKNLVNFGMVLSEKKLGVNTPFNLIAPIYTPINLKYRMFGVNNVDQMGRVYDLFSDLEYTNFLVLHGEGGIDEASIFSDTLIKGMRNGNKIEKTITPKDFGLKRVSYDLVKPVDAHSNTIDFLRIIYGLEKGAKRDMVLMNASLALYISDQTDDLKEGVNKALEAIESGEVEQKFVKLVHDFGEESVLNKMLEKHVL